jgi:hypothetical protein
MDDRDTVLGKFDPKFQVRIGDCQFVVPPEEISVNYISKAQRVSTLRSKGSLRKDMGQYYKRIQLSIYFSGLDQINGQPYNNTGSQEVLAKKALKLTMSTAFGA